MNANCPFREAVKMRKGVILENAPKLKIILIKKKSSIWEVCEIHDDLLKRYCN